MSPTPRDPGHSERDPEYGEQTQPTLSSPAGDSPRSPFARSQRRFTPVPPPPRREGPGLSPFWFGLGFGLVVVIVLAYVILKSTGGRQGHLAVATPTPTPLAIQMPPAGATPDPLTSQFGRTEPPSATVVIPTPSPAATSATVVATELTPTATPTPVPTGLPVEPGFYAILNGEPHRLDRGSGNSGLGSVADNTEFILYDKQVAIGGETARRAYRIYPLVLLPVMPEPPADSSRDQLTITYLLGAWNDFDKQVANTLASVDLSPPGTTPIELDQRAVDGQPDMLRIIPRRKLNPGLYQFADRARFFVERDRYAQIRSDSVAAMLEKGTVDRAMASAAVASELRRETPIRQSELRTTWSQTIAQIFGGAPRIGLNEAFALESLRQKWTPPAQGQPSPVLAVVRRKLAEPPDDPAALIPLFQEAVRLGIVTDDQLGGLALDAFSNLASAARPARDAIIGMAALVHGIKLPAALEAQSAAQFAHALHDYTRGNRQEAIQSLGQIAAKQASTPEARLATQILAPPTPGLRPVSGEPFNMEDSQGQPALSIGLKAVEVDERQVQFVFEVDNVGGKMAALLYAAPGAGGSGAQLHLLDDAGRKLESTTGFLGGRQAAVNPAQPDVYMIQFDPGEKTRIAARFPLPGPGATTVAFVSPDVRGQSEWRWPELRLKQSPFEPPLAITPLAGGRLTQVGEPIPPATGTAGAAAPTPTVTPAPATTPPSIPTDVLESDAAGQGSAPTANPAVEPGRADEPKTAGGNRAAMEEARGRARDARDDFLADRSMKEAEANPVYRAGEEQYMFARRLDREGQYDRAAFYYEHARKLYVQAVGR